MNKVPPIYPLPILGCAQVFAVEVVVHHPIKSMLQNLQSIAIRIRIIINEHLSVVQGLIGQINEINYMNLITVI